MGSSSALLCTLCATLARLGASASYPGAPWAQYGTAYVQEIEVDAAIARDIVPMEYGIVETKKGSGKTAGSIYVVRYGNTSTLSYSEFIFIPATVTYRGETGSWASHVFVDSPAALQAGREVWGFNKTLGVFEWDRATSPKLQHIKLTEASTGQLVIDASFNDDVLVTIPGQSQTEQSFGQGATAGAATGQPLSTIVLSSTKQKYGVKLLSEVILNVPDSSPLARAFTTAGRGTKVAMHNGFFNMTAPKVLGRPSRAKHLWRTTPEVGPNTLSVTRGAMPTWLRGTLIRNSASGYVNGADEMRHWNDGWSQLHRWQLSGDDNGGAVVHTSKWLNTSSYFEASTEGKIPQTGYGTSANPGPRPHKPLEAQQPPPTPPADASLTGITDKFSVNPMVNVWKFDDKYMATTDQNLFVEFDPETLTTLGDINKAWDPNDPITKKGLTSLGVAHGRYDRQTKEHFWLEIDMGQAPVLKAKYNIWTYQETGHNGSSTLPPRKLLATLEDADTSFVHSFGLTENYVVLIQCPFHYDFLKFPLAKEVIDAVSWDASKATRFHVFRRDTGALVRSVDASDGAWFVYHVLNAFEDPKSGAVTIDFSRYENSSLITEGMYLENMVDMPEHYTPTYAQAKLNRCSIDLDASAGAPSCAQVMDDTFEMATFNWEHYHMAPVRYTWGANFIEANTPWNRDGVSDFIDQIVKVDIDAGKVTHKWGTAGTYVCEPIFAPRPGATAEDDGALLSVGFDADVDQSFLVVINATTMEEMARVNMVGHLAANFHGKWCPEGSDHCIGL